MADAGEVVWLEFPGAVATKRRPALVLSSGEYHATRPDINVGLITSQIGKASGPTDHILNDWKSAGLRLPSAFRAFVTTLPKATIVAQMGRLSDSDWQEVRGCVRRALTTV